MHKCFLPLIFSICFAVNMSCQNKQEVNYPANIARALALAGENGEELKSVLAFFNEKPGDSLKFAAAYYLIGHMEGHFSQASPRQLPASIVGSYNFLDKLTKRAFYAHKDDALYQYADFMHQTLDNQDFIPTTQYLDSIIKHGYHRVDTGSRGKLLAFESTSDSIADQLLNLPSVVPQPSARFEDLRSLKADWLIDHINNAFEIWKKSPTAKNLDFSGFCTNILPYRSQNEIIDVNSSFLLDRFKPVFGPECAGDLKEIVNRLNFYIYCMDVLEDNGRNIGALGFYDILQYYKYDCDRHSEWTVRVLNACGIPAVLDFTSGFFNRDKLHYGVSIMDSSGIYHHFTPKWQQLGDTLHSKMFAKVFRRTFEKQACPYTLKQSSETVPSIFNSPFIKDVTREYHHVGNVSVHYSTTFPETQNLAYLAIFTPNGWKPIGWGTVDRQSKSMKFKQVPLQATYIAGYYRGGSLHPLSDPFFVGNDSKVSFITSGKERVDLTLTKKYPEKEKMLELMHQMVGAKVQGANSADFSDAKTLYTLAKKDVENFNVKAIKLATTRPFRYLRCISGNGKPLNIATLEFFIPSEKHGLVQHGSLPAIATRSAIRTLDTTSQTYLKGNPIQTGQNVDNAFDQNLETFVNDFSIGVDLGSPYVVTEFRIAARNSNNGIVSGDRYKLLYYSDGWHDAGIQKASYNFITFKQVPANTVYWLRNLDHGKEEQVFIYKNGRQIFLNNELSSHYRY